MLSSRVSLISELRHVIVIAHQSVVDHNRERYK